MQLGREKAVAFTQSIQAVRGPSLWGYYQYMSFSSWRDPNCFLIQVRKACLMWSIYWHPLWVWLRVCLCAPYQPPPGCQVGQLWIISVSCNEGSHRWYKRGFMYYFQFNLTPFRISRLIGTFNLHTLQKTMTDWAIVALGTDTVKHRVIPTTVPGHCESLSLRRELSPSTARHSPHTEPHTALASCGLGICSLSKLRDSSVS